MIDYDKLRIAHELCCNTESYYFDIALGMDDGCIALYDANNNAEQFICNPEDLDDLIAKLQELNPVQQKYKIDQQVWSINRQNNAHGQALITDVDDNSVEKYYIAGEIQQWYREDEIWATESQLIEAQIEYWQKMKADIQINQHEVDIDRCQHEIDYGHKLLNPLQQICIKCGEFYK